jgi:hypothetical protein
MTDELILSQIKNLSPGLVVKNYKSMCELLHQFHTSGEARQKQIKNWERFFAYNKLGQKYIITEIYDEPMEPEYRKYQRGIYVKFVEIILRTLLSTKENNFYDVTKQQLWQDLGMINKKYKRIGLSDLNKELKEYVVSLSEIKTFYRKCDSRLSEILKSSLNGLVSRRIIDYKIQKVILYSNNNELDYIVAEGELNDKIRNIERDVLDTMKLRNMEEVRKTLRYDEFYELRDKYGHEQYGWIRIFDRYHIEFDKATVLKNIATDKKELQEIMLEFNEKIIEAIDKSNEAMVNKQHEKAKEQYEEKISKKKIAIGKAPTYSYRELKIFDYDEDYLPKTKQLSNQLISIKHEKPL